MFSWREEIEAVFGSPVATEARTHGGDLSEVMHVTLQDGQDMAIKFGRLVGAEARMLQAMRLTGAPVPQVLHQGGTMLCLEWMAETAPTPQGWQALAEGLRTLHDSRGGLYGWPEDYAFGRVTIANGHDDDWPGFWAENRLLPFCPDLPGPLAARVEALARTLPDRLPARPAAALLHGDIWTGNALFSGDRAWLIDPACYHGHAEVDLAMLVLFAEPGPAFDEAYGAPEPGRDDRQPIYQLWPALVHHQLFGESYRAMVEGLLDRSGV